MTKLNFILNQIFFQFRSLVYRNILILTLFSFIIINSLSTQAQNSANSNIATNDDNNQVEQNENDKNTSDKPIFTITEPTLNIKNSEIKSVKINISLPQGFHAYSDQFIIKKVYPETYKAGQIMLSPEIDFFDKHFKKNRKGLFEKGEIQIQVEAPESLPQYNELEIHLKYQICSDQICYLPQTEKLTFNINSDAIQPGTSQTGFFSVDSIEHQLSKNFFLTYLFVFLAGILTSFTPCIFPMIPITLSILGHQAHHQSKQQNVLRSIFYVLGIALTYSILGVIAAATGSLFGKALTNKYVLSGMVLLFITMALSMWGAFELQVPAFIRNKFGTGKSKGYLGALTMGLVAGIVASPCVGPVLVSILSFVSSTQNITLGFTLLFTYAVGLGLIFIALGFSGQLLKKLPRSGPWMDFIKFVLGLLMIIAALYYTKFIVTEKIWYIVLSIVMMSISIWQGVFNYSKKHPIRQGIFLTSFIAFLILLLSTFFNKNVFLASENRPIENQQNQQAQLWLPYSQENLALAQSEDKPVLLDFYAEWCGACHELDDKTYTHPEFLELSQKFRLIKFDATEDTPEVQAILSQYKIQGLPTVIFMNKKGEIIRDLTFTQFLPWEELKPRMEKALNQ